MPKVVVVPGRVRVHLCPKVASWSLNRAFHQEKRAHFVGPDEDGDEFRFVTVRHPADRLVSCWAYFCTGAHTEISGQPQFAKLGYYHGMDLREFVEVACERHWENPHTRFQADFAGPHDADEYCLLSNIDAGWQRLRRRYPDLKVMRELPRAHRTQRAPWVEYFDAERLSRVEDVFASDMELFEKAAAQE